MTLVIARRTTTLIDGGHRGLQAYKSLYAITSTFFITFYYVFQNPNNVIFLRFWRVSYVFSNYVEGDVHG